MHSSQTLKSQNLTRFNYINHFPTKLPLDKEESPCICFHTSPLKGEDKTFAVAAHKTEDVAGKTFYSHEPII